MASTCCLEAPVAEVGSFFHQSWRICYQCHTFAQGFNLGGIKYCDYKRLPEDTERDLGATFAELDEVVSSADIVTVHVPLSDKTCALALGASWLHHCFHG